MTDDSDDPNQVFTPRRKSPSSHNLTLTEKPPASLSPNATWTRHNGVKDAPFFIEVPTLNKEEKEKYQPLGLPASEVNSEDEDASEVVEIVGEYKLARKRYLFARHGDNIVRKKEAWEFEASYPNLYETYEKTKAEGLLKPFDPSASYVHPKDRMGLVIRIKRAKNLTERSSEDEMSQVSDSEASEEGSDDDFGEPRQLRARETRFMKRTQSKYPRAPSFSPKKTRARVHGQSNPIELGEESDVEHELPKRRSSRSTRKKVYTINDDSEYESEEERDSSGYEDNKPSRKAKKVIKRKGPKPAYGRIRNVEDLYDSDPETAPLREHRDFCEKCRKEPAHLLLKRKKRKRRRKDEDELSETEEANRLGGWVRCLKCCVSAHWGCLASTQRAEIVKAARAKAVAESGVDNEICKRIKDVETNETTEFICGQCSKGGICMVCEEVAIEAETKSSDHSSHEINGNAMDVDESPEVRTKPPELGSTSELLFRCLTCKRLAHYSHLSVDDKDFTPAEIAEYFQSQNEWKCSNCASYIFPLDKIIAWRPSPPTAVDPYANSSEIPNCKAVLPREYLVKWVNRSFRRTEWVPHMWLVATHLQKLKNFYVDGPRMELLQGSNKDASSAQNDPAGLDIFAAEEENSRDVSAEADGGRDATSGPPAASPNAEQRISPLWKTVDRVLDVLIWAPQRAPRSAKKAKGKASKLTIQDDDDSEDDPLSLEAQAEYDAAWKFGKQPSNKNTETIDEFEGRTGRSLCDADAGKVMWAFIKWDDLPYDETSWDSPPRPETFGYSAYRRAFKYFLLSRSVIVKKKSNSEVERFEKRNGKKKWDSTSLGVPEDGKYDIGQDEMLKLMPFQVDGVNWLCSNWFHHQQCILADEMGLGKTVQIITFLGILHARVQAFPSLIVVPNSTITNWVREFARWAPELRVVPFYGEQKSREIIKKYELQHDAPPPGTTGAKYHVLVTTYETVTAANKDFNAVFKKNPRWEVLIVDEGQRLKSDSNLIFKRLNELHSCHRIIMTGTPLNNNIRELFNLMNFLNPEDWKDLEALAREFEELDEERVKMLHERLRPYFLRRVKADVLDLPPKNEVIVPISMAPLQKEVYKSILSKNLAVLRSLTETSSKRLNKSFVNKSNLRNMLMQLRKCLQHPYLMADDIEPKGLSVAKTHHKLIDASGKLRFLKTLLPKLKARGHRVLLFSQFVIGLDIIEDFLQGEGYKFLRLDGKIKQAERQKSMDEFNRVNSDVFIFILSTRAGGVGINLWSADTVIIYDPDFNPHQDLQAIARAHRFGQKKTCLVFKFMTKDSAEEKIIQTGKKKLVLDHLIVQKMDDEENTTGVQSMLTFGAEALFDDTEGHGSRDITYSETDVEKLVEKIETEGDQVESSESSNNAFAFAKVWSAHKDVFDELPDDIEDADKADSWTQALQKIAADQTRVEAREEVGRGVRRKAALVKTNYVVDGSPEKTTWKGRRKGRSHTPGSSDDEYNLPPARSRTDSQATDASIARDSLGPADPENWFTDDGRPLEKAANTQTGPSSSKRPSLPIFNQSKTEGCGLCGTSHGPGRCHMTENSENLAEYRKILILSEEEPYGDRAEAVRSIDETLVKRKAVHLIEGQPLKPMKKQAHSRSAKSSMPGSRHDNTPSLSQPIHLSGEAEMSGKSSAAAPPPFFALLNLKANAETKPVASRKRNLPPSSEQTIEKKAKVHICEICRQAPYHTPAICPEVAKGPKSVTKAIARLTNEGSGQETLSALRSILRKQKKALEDVQVHTLQPAASTSKT
ncbi:hypothetical protein DFH11DRAFT_1557318 [Phellopilus nigrolimitatus]|nr:hypothetical protein DFH11DRAFT_1557318 [Phellopilus nigrolimitatus]